MNYLLFNPKADNGAGEQNAAAALEKIKAKWADIESKSVLELPQDFYKSLKAEDNVVILGGDGTLNHLANDLGGENPVASYYLFQAGTGNDFARDVKEEDKDGDLIHLNPYLTDLPKVTVKGKEYYFINGVGFGIDGDCCKIADEQKAKGKKKISYAGISIKLLLFTFKRKTAKVIVDGKEYTFKKVGIASAMNGRCYGGGMIIAPKQERGSHLLTNVVFHKASRLKTLIVFTKTFKGEHTKYNKMVNVLQGKKIEVHFDTPCALQIDGETILDVTSYVAEAR